MNRIGKAATFSATLALSLLCSCATSHSVHRRLPREIRLNQDAGRGDLSLVTLRLETGEKVPFVVDTGSPVTVLDESLEPKLGMRLGEAGMSNFKFRQKGGVYAARKLYVGRTQLMTGSHVITFDFKHSAMKGRCPPILAVLGMDVLQHYCIQLDFAAGKMRFLDDETADKRHWGKEFPLHYLPDGCPFVEENLVGTKGWASRIDTGCNRDGWLRPKLFEQWTNHAQLPQEGEVRSPDGILGSESYRRLSLFQDTSGPAKEPDSELNGIGLGVLARSVVTLDFPKQKMYLRRTSIWRLNDKTEEAEIRRLARSGLEYMDSLKKTGGLPGWSIKDKGPLRQKFMLILRARQLSIFPKMTRQGYFITTLSGSQKTVPGGCKKRGARIKTVSRWKNILFLECWRCFLIHPIFWK